MASLGLELASTSTRSSFFWNCSGVSVLERSCSIIEKPLTRFEVAELLGVSLPTVNRMMNDGRLQKIKLTPHGSARITPASVRTILYGPQTQEQPTASAEVF